CRRASSGRKQPIRTTHSVRATSDQSHSVLNCQERGVLQDPNDNCGTIRAAPRRLNKRACRAGARTCCVSAQGVHARKSGLAAPPGETAVCIIVEMSYTMMWESEYLRKIIFVSSWLKQGW